LYIKLAPLYQGLSEKRIRGFHILDDSVYGRNGRFVICTVETRVGISVIVGVSVAVGVSVGVAVVVGVMVSVGVIVCVGVTVGVRVR
jgi:hypothetical protein